MGQSLVVNTVVDYNSDWRAVIDGIWQIIQMNLLHKGGFKSDQFKQKSEKIRQLSEADYLYNLEAGISSALKLINEKKLAKIVFAHAVDFLLSASFDLFETINNLRVTYPNCFTFSFGNNRGQTFIGATPECLFSVQDLSLLSVALAGSAPRGRTQNEDTHLAYTLLHDKKEMREHYSVSSYIVQCLLSLGITPQVSQTSVLKLSNIQHLRSEIQSSIPASFSLFKILAQLHPTPAVGGTPKDTACNHLRLHEEFERGCYAAPLGWIDYKGNGEFFVGIRSAMIHGLCARLYAGVGIVMGSDIRKEMIEIQLKLQPLLEALV